MNQDYKGNL